MTTTTTTPTSTGRRAAAPRRAITVAGATLAALAVWAVAVPGLGTDLVTRFGAGTPQTVGAGFVAAGALASSLLGWGLLTVLERRTHHARAIWTAAALAVLAASFSLPLIAATKPATAATLALMHVAVAAVLIPLLPARRLHVRSNAMTTTNSTSASPRPKPRLSRTARLVIAGAVAAGAAGTAFVAVTGNALAATATTAVRTITSGYPGTGPWNNWGHPGPQSAWPGFGPATGWSGFGPRAGWPGSGPGGWAPVSPRSAEYFHVASTNQSGPGAIIVTGVINAGGIEHPGRAIDNASFSDGSFRIDHSSGHPTVHFNPTTCIGTITQSGPFRVYAGTGLFSHLNGSGMYQFAAMYTTARGASGCTKTVTAYLETINGAIPRIPSAARSATPGA